MDSAQHKFEEMILNHMQKENEIYIYKMIRDGSIIADNTKSKMNLDLINRIGVH